MLRDNNDLQGPCMGRGSVMAMHGLVRDGRTSSARRDSPAMCSHMCSMANLIVSTTSMTSTLCSLLHDPVGVKPASAGAAVVWRPASSRHPGLSVNTQSRKSLGPPFADAYTFMYLHTCTRANTALETLTHTTLRIWHFMSEMQHHTQHNISSHKTCGREFTRRSHTGS